MLQQAPQPGTRQCPQGHHQGGGNLPKSAITRFRIRVVHTRGRPLRKALVWCCSAALMDDCAQLCQDWQQHHLIPSDRQRQRPGKLSLGEVLFNDGALPSLPRQGPQAFLPLWGGAGVRHPLLSFPGTSRFVVLTGLAQRVPALWAGSLASSSICPSTTGARSWPSRSQGAMRDARQPLEPMTVLYGASSSVHCQAPHATPMAAGSESAHWLLHHEEPPPPSAGQATAEKTIQH